MRRDRLARRRDLPCFVIAGDREKVDSIGQDDFEKSLLVDALHPVHFGSLENPGFADSRDEATDGDRRGGSILYHVRSKNSEGIAMMRIQDGLNSGHVHAKAGGA